MKFPEKKDFDMLHINVNIMKISRVLEVSLPTNVISLTCIFEKEYCSL